MDNTTKKVTPDSIKRWNWGAFVFSWIWGIFNNVWISLLALIPIVNVVMMFVLGAKGNQWAWEKSDITDVELFLKKQRKWNIAAAIFGIFFLLLFTALIGSCGRMMYNVNVGATKDKIITELNNDNQVVEILGAPVDKNSFITFNTRSKLLRNGEWASLDIYTFNAKGSKTSGGVVVAWLIYQNKEYLVDLEITPNNGARQVLVDPSQNNQTLPVVEELLRHDKNY